MLAKSLEMVTRRSLSCLPAVQSRMFSYSVPENNKLRLELNRKLNAIKMTTLDSEFTYE
jgi:hypothetical protein